MHLAGKIEDGSTIEKELWQLTEKVVVTGPSLQVYFW